MERSSSWPPAGFVDLAQRHTAIGVDARSASGGLSTKDPLLASRLKTAYIKAMESYFHSVFVIVIPPLFYQPMLLFYLSKPGLKSSEICCISPFPYGTRQSHKLTKKTFPAFLVNACSIPYSPGSHFDRFYAALEDLLLLSPRTRLQVVVEHIKQQAPYFAAWLTVFKGVKVSRDRNLFVSNEQLANLYTYGPTTSSSHQSVLALAQEKILPAPLMRQYLNALLAEYDGGIGDHGLPEDALPSQNSIVFRGIGSDTAAVVTAQYLLQSDSFSALSQPPPLCGLKTIAVGQNAPSANIPGAILPLFQGLCGDNTALLDQMATALSKAMDPVSGNGMTVFYCKHNKDLLDGVLHQIFQDSSVLLRFKPHAKSITTVPSLNQVTKRENLLQMFLAQTDGAAVVFVRDSLPSDASLKRIRLLLRGRNVAISSPACPPQHYQNNLHFLCVTDDYSRAQVLQKKLKAELIDLSTQSAPLDNVPPLTAEDVHWLRTAFLLYGLKRRTLSGHDLAVPVPPAPIPSLQDEIQTFLDTACTKQRGLCCDTFYLFTCFLAFYRQRHQGMEPDTTKISFNKSVRGILKSSHSKAITYRKLRPDPHATPRWHYVGIYPQQTSIQSFSQVEAPPELMPAHLLRIHQCQLQLDFANGRELTLV